MSEKIKIMINGEKPDLSSLFHKYLSANGYGGSSYGDYGYNGYDDDDYWGMVNYYNNFYDDDDDDDGCVVFPIKPRKHGKNKRYKGSVLECDYDDDDFYKSRHLIYFYPDYHNKGDRLEFDSLTEFSEYCDTRGYSVDDSMLERLMFCYECHCCPSGLYNEFGLEEIVVEHSYGDMFYDVCKTSEIQ